LVVAPEVDLLWGNTPGGIYVGGAVSVTIGMAHKFSQVTVSVGLTSTSPVTLGKPSSVSISPGYQGSLNLLTGVMGKGSSVAQPVGTTWTGSSPTFTGTPRLVHTYGEKPVTVTVGSVTAGSITYTNKVAKFNLALVEGKKYSLTMDLKRTVVWAGSNVYWVSTWGNEGYLTFDAPGSGDAAQKKQGVFFKWGSLIGISPASQGDIEIFQPDPQQYAEHIDYADYGTNTTLYVPGGSSGWTATTGQDWYSDFPGIYEGFAVANPDAYLSDDLCNTVYDRYSPGTPYWSSQRGDICRYISENGHGPGVWGNNYRLPSRAEMGEKSSYSYGGSDGWAQQGIGNSGYFGGGGTADGTTGRGEYASNSGVIFPASGCRTSYSGIDGVVRDVEGKGYYWNASRGEKLFDFSSSSLYLSYYGPDAASVRCVRAN
jgi:hypothetical protein